MQRTPWYRRLWFKSSLSVAEDRSGVKVLNESAAKSRVASKSRRSVLFAAALGVLGMAGCGGSRDEFVKPAVETWQSRLQNAELDEVEFTRIVQSRITSVLPGSSVQIQQPLTVVVHVAEGEFTCQLWNSWNECRDMVSNRPAIVERFLEELRSSLERVTEERPLALENIVPVVKSAQWLAEADQQGMQLCREPLAEDLFVIYAEDDPNQLRFATEAEVAEFHLSAKELRTRSIVNLAKRLPSIKRMGNGPLYMLAAGGTFESSLLLLENVWKDYEDDVDGRIVAAVPSRDLLMFTGENATEAIRNMRTIANDVQHQGSHLISTQLLVRTAKGWEHLPDENEVPKLRLNPDP